MASGAGTMRAGLGPCGLGTPLSAAAPATGAAGIRFINPATGDYEIDGATGQLAQMPSVRQRVLLALSTSLGSSSVQQGFGLKMPKKLGTKFRAELEQSIRTALAQLTDVEKVCRIDAIDIDVGASAAGTTRARPTVRFTDLTTNKQDHVRP